MPLGRRAMACMLAVWLAAPSFAATEAAKYYEDALARYERHDDKGAIVQLKNALQKDPRMLSAQVLLADAYLRIGQPAGAEVALDAAEKLGADRALLTGKFAQAYMGQFKYQELLDRLNPRGLPPLAAAEVQANRGLAHLGLGELQKAWQALEEAERLNPSSLAVQVAKATVLLRRNDLAGARAQAARAVALAPDDAEVFNLQGAIAHTAGDLQAALGYYGKAIAQQVDHLEARVSRAGLLIDLKRDAEADQDLAYLRQRYPNEPRTGYLTSLIAARKGDREATRKALMEVAKVLSLLPQGVVMRSTQLLLIGGLTSYGLKQPEQARLYLERLIELQPGHAGARKLLASLLLDAGQHARVIELLEPIVGDSETDPQVFAMLAAAHQGRRQFERAAQLYERAARLSGNAPEILVGLGISRIGAGQEAAGIALLEQAYARDPAQTRAGMALVGAYLRRGETGKAVDLARRIAARQPDDVSAQHLLGSVLLGVRDPAGARAAFTRAVQIRRNFMPAQISLARLDYVQGRRAEARKRLMAILRVRLDDPAAITELARMEETEGRLGEAIAWLEKLRTGASPDLGAMLYLVQLYLKSGDPKNALSLAQELGARHPGDATVQETLGRTYLAANKPEQARITFRDMSRAAGFDSRRLTHVARLQIEAGDLHNAEFSLNKALSSTPDYLPAKLVRVEMDIRAGRLAEAEKRAMDLRAAHPGQVSIHRLLGDIRIARKDWTGALAEYRAVLDKQPGTQNVLTLYRVHLLAGGGKAGVAVLEDWLRGHPADMTVRLALAEGYTLTGQHQAARTAYEAILKQRGGDATILNNYANVLLRLGDRGAMTYAEKAYALSPNDASVIDTLGWALVRSGKAEQALPYLRDARLRAAGNREIQYHLGMALYQLGRRAEAKRELQEALAGNAVFEGAEQARSVLSTI